MSRGVSFDTVKALARDRAEELARKLLPDGVRKGQWWVTRVPWRDDRKPSLHFSLTTARYQDYGGADSGTVIDLVMKLDRCDSVTALKTLAGLLGIDESRPRPKPAPVVRCRNCCHAYVRRVPQPPEWCCNITFVDDGEQPWAMTCRTSRRDAWPCGRRGRLFEARSA